MSYDCCKRITLNKGKNYIGLCVASNNVFPKSYGTYEMCSRDKEIYKIYNFEDKLICLLRSMLSGDIQITSINSNTEKFEYALIKVREYLRDNNMNSYDDLYEKFNDTYYHKRLKFANIQPTNDEYKDREKLSDWAKKQKEIDKMKYEITEEKMWLDNVWEVYGKVFDIFKNALIENHKGTYEVIFNDYYKVSKVGKYDRGYSNFSYIGDNCKGLEMSYYKAYILKHDMGKNRKLEIKEI